MKKIYYTLFAFLSISIGLIQAQTITFNGCHVLFDNQDYIFNLEGTDGTGRNYYITTPVDGAQTCGGIGTCEFKIIWNDVDAQWEFLADDGNGDFSNPLLIYYNTNPSSPFPPAITAGTWVENTSNTSSDCGGNLTPLNASFTGDLDFQAPSVTSVTVPANATYVANQNLDLIVNFDENVIVDLTNGTPQINITIGTTVKQATYQSGTGSSALLFSYELQCGDQDTDGIAIGTLELNNGNITDVDTNVANLTLNSIGSTTDVLVETGPTVDNSLTESTPGILTANQAGASYQWYECFDQTLLDGEVNQSITPGTVNEYNVKITINGCSVFSDCTAISATLGYESFDNLSPIVIYPNPTNRIINIETNISGDCIIVNQLGQTVQSFSLNSNVENKVDVGNLDEGVYFIKGINQTEIGTSKLIIKK